MSAFAVALVAWLCVVGAAKPLAVSRRRIGQASAPARFPWATVAAAVCMTAGVLFQSPLLVLPAPAAIGLASRRVRLRRAAAGAAKRDAAVPIMLDSAVQRLQTGSSFGRSVVDALGEDPVLGSLPAVVAAVSGIDGGGSVGDELQVLAQSIGYQGDKQSASGEWARLLAATTAVLLDAGGQGATALDRLAATVRTNTRVRAEAAAQAGQATASAAVLGVLPLLFAFVIAVLDADARTLYVSTWTGAFCLLVAIGLTALCWSIFDRVLSGGSRR